VFLLIEKLKMQNNCMPTCHELYWYKTWSNSLYAMLYVARLAIRFQDYENVS